MGSLAAPGVGGVFGNFLGSGIDALVGDEDQVGPGDSTQGTPSPQPAPKYNIETGRNSSGSNTNANNQLNTGGLPNLNSHVSQGAAAQTLSKDPAGDKIKILNSLREMGWPEDQLEEGYDFVWGNKGNPKIAPGTGWNFIKAALPVLKQANTNTTGQETGRSDSGDVNIREGIQPEDLKDIWPKPPDPIPEIDPRTVPGKVPHGSDVDGYDFYGENLPGFNWAPPIAGAALGALGGLREDPVFDRMETMRDWDKEGRGRYSHIWKQSEQDPYHGAFFRDSARMLGAQQSGILENAADRTERQRLSGGQVMAGQNQANLAAMLPGFYGQMANQLGRAYDVQHDAARFRDRFDMNNTDRQQDLFVKEVAMGTHSKYNRGMNLIAGRVIPGAISGFGSGMKVSEGLLDYDAKKKTYEQGLGVYLKNSTAKMRPQVQSEDNIPELQPLGDALYDFSGMGPHNEHGRFNSTNPHAPMNQWNMPGFGGVGGSGGGPTPPPGPAPQDNGAGGWGPGFGRFNLGFTRDKRGYSFFQRQRMGIN